jgi:hypothetical protein
VSEHDALPGDMRSFLYGSDGDSLALSADTAERLLSGRPSPGIPPVYAEVAEVLVAAAAPARPGELASAPLALEAFRAACRPSRARRARASTRTSRAGIRTRTRPSRVLRTAVLAAVVLVLAMLAGTALATGTLWPPPGRGPRTTSGPDGQAPVTTDVPFARTRVAPGPPAHPGDTDAPSATSVLPGASAQALCRAYVAGGGNEKTKAAAFQALAAAAGGTDRVAAYCRGLVPVPDITLRPDAGSSSGSHAGSPPAPPGASNSTPGSRAPACAREAGNCGNGQGVPQGRVEPKGTTVRPEG